MRLDSSARSLDKALLAITSLESAEFDSNGELTDLDPEYSEQLLEDIRDALKNTSIDELPPSLQDLARRYRRQQAGQDGEGQKGEDGKERKERKGQGKQAGRDGKDQAQGKGRKGQGKQAGDKSGRQGKKNKGAGGTNRRFGLPRDPAQRQQALQDLKEFLQQESQQLQQLQQQAQRNPGGT
tara:strand:- start:6 stop:551 length:546 start_codon:yes stop_codon:yes gene_type:complete